MWPLRTCGSGAPAALALPGAGGRGAGGAAGGGRLGRSPVLAVPAAARGRGVTAGVKLEGSKVLSPKNLFLPPARG